MAIPIPWFTARKRRRQELEARRIAERMADIKIMSDFANQCGMLVAALSDLLEALGHIDKATPLTGEQLLEHAAQAATLARDRRASPTTPC